MATLMEIDVLLEVTSSVYAKVFYARGKIDEDERLADSQDVSDRQDRFYSTMAKNIDYQSELQELQELQKKYELTSTLNGKTNRY